MGLGKTVQTLAFLRAHQGNGPALIVCPTSLVTNWENEARKFTPELKTLVLGGADRADGGGVVSFFSKPEALEAQLKKYAAARV